MACFAYRTTPHASTGVAPFVMLFGRDAIFPRDAFFNNSRRVYSGNDEGYVKQLVDTMAEIWDLASKQLEEAQRIYKEQHDKRAKVRSFAPGSLVLQMHKEIINSKHIPSKFHPSFDYLFRVVADKGTDLEVVRVLPPFLKSRLIPKIQCKQFRGSIRDYSDYYEGIAVPVSEWSTDMILPRTRSQQTDTSHDPGEDIDYEENSICPICQIDYEHTKTDDWIYCDKCKQWFHFACVDLEEAPPTLRWYCPRCEVPKSKAAKGTSVATQD